MTKHLLPVLCTLLFASACGDGNDPRLDRMIALCEELDDCDEAIEALMDESDDVEPEAHEYSLHHTAADAFTVPLPDPDPIGPQYTPAPPADPDPNPGPPLPM